MSKFTQTNGDDVKTTPGVEDIKAPGAEHDGFVAKTLVYDAFGAITYESASPSLSNLWNGMSGYYDEGAAIGLTMAGARYYDPAIGSWLSRDPLISEWPYGYCGHDPVNLRDWEGTNPAAVVVVVAVPGVGEVVLATAAAAAGTYIIVKGVEWLWNKITTALAKGGKQRIRHTDLEGATTEELLEMLKGATGELKRKIEKELKARWQRNRQKRLGAVDPFPVQSAPSGLDDPLAFRPRAA